MSHQHKVPLNRAAFLDINSFPLEGFTNGANIQYREILSRLITRGVEAAVLTVAHDELSPRARTTKRPVHRSYTVLDDIPVIEYLIQAPVNEVDEYRLTIKRALLEFSPDIVFINTPPARLLEIEVAMAEELVRYGAVVFCFIPDDQFPRFDGRTSSLHRRYRECLLTFRVACPSHFIADRVTAALGVPFEYIPNLFTTPGIVCDSRNGTAITLINPHPMKGIRVFESIAGQMPHLTFLVVQGWPYPPSYEGGLSNITALPFEREMRSIWSLTKILLVPSLCNEGYGRVVVEAMLNGIPVIAHNKGGLPEAAGGAAILLDSPPTNGDPIFPEIESGAMETLVNDHIRAINSLLTDDENYEIRSRLSRTTAEEICEKAETRFAEILNDFNIDIDKSASPITGEIIVLSPHPDDVAFCIGGLIQKSILRSPVHILTLFGRSNYLRETGFQPDWLDVTEVRKSEEFAFASRVGVQLSYLEFPEASLRLGPSFERIFNDDNDADLPLLIETESVVQRRLDELNPVLLFSPLGLGGHKDHLLTRKLAQNLARKQNVPLVYYEDLPYAAELAEEKLFEYVSSVDPMLQPSYVPIEFELESKLNNLRSYQSQVGPEEISLVERYARLVGKPGAAERVWSSIFPLDFLRLSSP
jgi:LmbE family N-acetylglucosaminyl deacetylase/glycosyltransferase involved in cell wall biosynthesis